jgi:hypothetical protein
MHRETLKFVSDTTREGTSCDLPDTALIRYVPWQAQIMHFGSKKYYRERKENIQVTFQNLWQHKVQWSESECNSIQSISLRHSHLRPHCKYWIFSLRSLVSGRRWRHIPLPFGSIPRASCANGFVVINDVTTYGTVVETGWTYRFQMAHMPLTSILLRSTKK